MALALELRDHPYCSVDSTAFTVRNSIEVAVIVEIAAIAFEQMVTPGPVADQTSAKLQVELCMNRRAIKINEI